MNLNRLETLEIDGRFKGIPAGQSPFFLKDIHRHGWNLLQEDMELPLVVLKETALKNNSQWMREFLRRSQADICPHGKTTMSPQLFHQQLQDGAWGITVATVGQVKICRAFGVQRVLMANQLVGSSSIRWVLDALHQDPAFDFYCLVDSVKGVELLAKEAQSHPVERPLQVFIEMGMEQGRTGCRHLESALDVGRAIEQSAPHLHLRGIEGFEGLITASDPVVLHARLEGFLQKMVQAAQRCDQENFFAPGNILLTAGGSAYYDKVTEKFASVRLSQPVQIITRSGCYLTHDSGMYQNHFNALQKRSTFAQELKGGFQAALEVWAYVQSCPEAGLVILNFGKRDCSYDAGLPVPHHWFSPGQHKAPQTLPEGHRIGALNDQHAYLHVPENSPLQVGDMVACGISHPCTTFDKWQLIPVVDDAYQIVSAIKTYF